MAFCIAAYIPDSAISFSTSSSTSLLIVSLRTVSIVGFLLIESNQLYLLDIAHASTLSSLFAMATTSRCEFCVPLVIETSSQKEKLIFEHHASLSDLISCAETKFCHICHLFWASIQRLCSEEHLHQHLSGKSPSGTNRVYDHRMFLVVCQRYGNIMNINVWGEQPHKGERLGYLQICGLGISGEAFS